jgi:hypothetical protein
MSIIVALVMIAAIVAVVIGIIAALKAIFRCTWDWTHDWDYAGDENRMCLRCKRKQKLIRMHKHMDVLFFWVETW